MSRRLPRLLAAALALLVGAGVAWHLRNRAPPNVLLITLDTVRADRLGSYGYQGAATPTLDRLAAEGVRFEFAYSPTPLTLPAHATLLTGVQPPTHGLIDNGMRASRFPVSTLAERLRAAGYDTGAFVAAYVLNAVHGLDRGFALYDDGPDVAGDVFALFRGTAPAAERVDRLLEWLRGPRREPFFAWLHLFDAHAPYLPPAGFRSRFAANPYDGEIAYIDGQLARVLGYLEREQLIDDTLIVVTADHGESLGEHGEATHGVFLYDATLRVPLILHWPAGLSPRSVAEPAALVDVLPTMLGLLDLPSQSLRHGVDLFDTTPDPAPWRFFALSEYPRRQYGWARLTAMREGAMKFVDAPRTELYDLDRDPGELTNLAPDHGGSVATRLADALSVALAEMSAQAVTQAVDEQLTAQQRHELQSLGYLAAGVAAPAPTETAIDPKDGMRSLGPSDAAFDALARGDLIRAEALFGESLTATPLSLSSRDGMARTLELAGRDREAEAWHEGILAIDPEAVLSLARLVEIRIRRGDCAAAESAAGVLRRLLPDATSVDARLARCVAAPSPSDAQKS